MCFRLRRLRIRRNVLPCRRKGRPTPNWKICALRKNSKQKTVSKQKKTSKQKMQKKTSKQKMQKKTSKQKKSTSKSWNYSEKWTGAPGPEVRHMGKQASPQRR